MRNAMSGTIVFGWMMLCFALSLAPAPGAHGEGRREEGAVSPELADVLERIDEANRGLETVKARIEYTRAIPLLGESESSEGRLAFKTPDSIHLSLQRPRNEEIVTDGRTWWLVDHNARQVEIYQADREGGLAEASFLDIGYGRGVDELKRDYTITLLATEEVEVEVDGRAEIRVRRRLGFEPKDDGKPARFERMEVRMTEPLFLPETIVLHESDGEIIHTFRLSDIVLNDEIEDSRFVHEVRRGYGVIQP